MCTFSHGEFIECDQEICDDCRVYKKWLLEDDFEYHFFEDYDRVHEEDDGEEE